MDSDEKGAVSRTLLVAMQLTSTVHSRQHLAQFLCRFLARPRARQGNEEHLQDRGTSMKRVMIAIVVAALCLATAYTSLAAPAKSASKQQIAHGEYLVKVIAQCGDCHTPMDEKGE